MSTPYESSQVDEAPEADLVEQSLPVRDEDEPEGEFDVPLEADPADAADQRRPAGSDDEDGYR